MRKVSVTAPKCVRKRVPIKGVAFALALTLASSVPGLDFAHAEDGQFVVPVLNISHAHINALAASLSVSTKAATLMGFNCSAVTGGAAGYCIAYNSASTPGTGALTGANVIDVCYFDATARGCSLGRASSQVTYSAGIQILVTSAASPFTYTTGVDTAFISADFR